MKNRPAPALTAGILLTVCLVSSAAHAGVAQTRAFKLSVTLPASSSITAESTDLSAVRDQESSEIPDRDIITEEALRGNESVVIKTAIVK